MFVRTLVVQNGDVLVPERPQLETLDVVIAGSIIDAVEQPGAANRPGVHAVDASGAIVLPGIVDVHGDAFERAIMPRPGVTVDVGDALAHNDAQLLAAGITTAYLSITDSWEPGLRSRSTMHAIIDACRSDPGVVDRRIHVRHERCNTEGFDQLLSLITEGVVHMVSYNDHTPGGIALVRPGVSRTQVGRSGVSEADLIELQSQAIASRERGLAQDDELASACRDAGCPTASHDAHTSADLHRDGCLGVGIAEFPTSIDLAHRYLAEGIDVLLGAPNLVRGGSHLGNLSVREAVVAGAGTLLCSDYHYPSLLQAPFTLAELGIVGFDDAWAMVSANPANAAGLTDRGRIEPDKRADLIVVEPPTAGRGPRVRSVIINGEVVYSVAPR